ncbi:MAG: hypothetical protein HFE28_04270 [Clostridia bacterium]|jgi:hypothetical protein|nr:hypothetical protein [Clostridia bacterium]
MKKLWIFLFILTVAAGITLSYAGALNENLVMERCGIAVLFGGIYLVLLAAILVNSILAYKRAKNAGAKESEELNPPDRDGAATYLFGGSILSGKIKQKNVVLVSMFVQITVISCLFGGIGLLSAHCYPAAVVLLCVFGVSIFSLTLTAIIKFLCFIMKDVKKSDYSIKGEDQPDRVGTVISCTASSEEEKQENERVFITVIEIDGAEYTTAGRQFYEKGTQVVASTQGNLALIDQTETEKLQQNKE